MGYTQFHRYSEGAVRRKKMAFYEKGPGPATFLLPTLVGRKNHAVTHLMNPEYSLRAKFDFKPLGVGPGAGAYLIPWGVKHKGWDKAPAYTMGTQTKCMNYIEEGPGPARYDTVPLNKYKFSAPKCSIGSRKQTTSLRPSRIRSPAPNSYILPPAIGPKIPDKLAAPEVTLKGRREGCDEPECGVGKGGEGPPRSYNIKKSFPNPTPAFSFGRRWPESKKMSFNAGPASYSPEKCQICRKIGQSFKYRYNDFTGIFRTECDKRPITKLD